MRGTVLVACTLFSFLFACGGGDKKAVEKPTTDDEEVTEDKPRAETPEDREKKRRQQAAAIIPEGSSCLPPSLKEENAPRLELGADGIDAVVCAIDSDGERLLGTIGCWKVNLNTGKLTFKDREPLPGRSVTVKLRERCARGYCLPKAATAEGDIAHMATNLDRSKVAMLVGEEVHLFDGKSKAHESSFSIRGDKGVSNDPTAVHFVGETLIVEGADQGPYAAVWVFKSDGTQVGPVTQLGGKDPKPVSTHGGSFSILDKNRIGVAEKGMATLTAYDVATGARAKLVRKVPKLSCKAAEVDAFWVDGDKVTDKCRASIEKASGHLIGASVIAGARSLLVLFRGSRLGELGVLDPKTLAEKSVIKMPWCEADGGGADDSAETTKKTTRGPVKASSADPEAGGE